MKCFIEINKVLKSIVNLLCITGKIVSVDIFVIRIFFHLRKHLVAQIDLQQLQPLYPELPMLGIYHRLNAMSLMMEYFMHKWDQLEERGGIQPLLVNYSSIQLLHSLSPANNG